MNLIPLSNFVIVRPLPNDNFSAGGILLPEVVRDSSKLQSYRGEILAAGPGFRRQNSRGTLVPMGTKPGDRVLYTGYGHTRVMHDGEPALLMREPEIIGVIEE